MALKRESPGQCMGVGSEWGGLAQSKCYRQFVLGLPISFTKKLLLSPYQAHSVKAVRDFHGSPQRRAMPGVD